MFTITFRDLPFCQGDDGELVCIVENAREFGRRSASMRAAAPDRAPPTTTTSSMR